MLSKYRFISLVCASSLLLTALPGLAQEDEFAVDSLVQSFEVDLDQDGQAESVQVRVAEVNGMGRSDQIVVVNSSGDVLWKGPVLEPNTGFDNEQPIFGSWHFGVSEVNLVADLNHDGVVDLLGPAPQSDVRPQAWRQFSWTGQGFEFVAMGYLIQTAPEDFTWTNNINAGDTWIKGLEMQDGELVAHLWKVTKTGEMYYGQAVVSVSSQGMAFERWIETLSEM